MLSCTLREYKNNYESRLSTYENDYEDKTETSFLERELINYSDYCNILIKIADCFNSTTSKKLTKNKSLVSYITYLRKINEPVYNDIFTKGAPFVDSDQEISENGIEDEMIGGYILPPSDIIFKKIDNLITSAKRILDFINEQQKNSQTKKNDKQYKNQIWFKLGVLFASGKMDKYYTINDKGETSIKPAYTAPRVAEELGDKRYNKCILATLNNYVVTNPNGSKNIFNSRDKMLKIISHCNEQDISVIPYFIEHIPPE